MRVLHVISGIEPENGGPTAALAGHCRALVAAGVQMSIVATWKYESSFKLAETLRAGGIPVTLLGPTKRPFRTHPDMDRVLSDAIARHDVVHIHAVWEWIEHRAAVLARRLGKPYVWTPHGMLDVWNFRRNRLFKTACMTAYLRRDLRGAAVIHVATDFEARQVERLKPNVPLFVQGFGLDAELLDSVATGPSVLESPVPRGRFRARLRLWPTTPLVLFLGRIQHGKGLEILIPAVRRTTSQAVLAVVGPAEGDVRQRMETIVAEQGLSSRVIFVGMLHGQEKFEALADADVLAAPSAHENFGISVAEAVAMGTPVCVSDQVGLADAIRRHGLGEVAPLTEIDTAAALDRVLAAGRHETLSRAYARSHFAWPAIAAAWVKQYDRLRTSNSIQNVESDREMNRTEAR